MVLAALLGIGLGLSPMPIYTFGVFAPHLAADFGWSMAEIMSGLAVTTIVVVAAGPLTGFLAVRYGARRVALLSSLSFGLALCALSFTNGSLPLFYATWALIAAVGAGTLPITWTRPVNRIFDVHKGMALGLSMIGSGIFGMLSKPYLAWAIESYGWRGAYVALGLLPILIAFPAGFLLLREPDTDKAGRALHDAAVPNSGGGLTLGEAMQSWRFWLLALALVPISFALGGPLPNLEVILRDSGLAGSDILKLTPLLGLTALIGRLIGGWLMDRFWAPAVGFVILGLPVISCWIFMAPTLDFQAAALAIILIGLALGVEFDLIAFLVARYFGMRSYPAIYGCLYVSFALGAGLAPAFFGRDHDRHGNYDFAFTVSLVLLISGAAALLLLGRYRRFGEAGDILSQPVPKGRPMTSPAPMTSEKWAEFRERMPLLHDSAGVWEGWYRYYDAATGALTDQHRSRLICRIMPEGSPFPYHQTNIYFWEDGRIDTRDFPAWYDDGRIWWDNDLITGWASEMKPDDYHRSTVLNWTRKGDPDLYLYELIQHAANGIDRARTWQWFRNDKCYLRTLIDEQRVTRDWQNFTDTGAPNI